MGNREEGLADDDNQYFEGMMLCPLGLDLECRIGYVIPVAIFWVMVRMLVCTKRSGRGYKPRPASY